MPDKLRMVGKVLQCLYFLATECKAATSMPRVPGTCLRTWRSMIILLSLICAHRLHVTNRKISWYVRLAQIFVFFPDEVKVGVKTIKVFAERMRNESVQRAIMVVIGSLTPFSRQCLAEMQPTYYIEMVRALPAGSSSMPNPESQNRLWVDLGSGFMQVMPRDRALF